MLAGCKRSSILAKSLRAPTQQHISKRSRERRFTSRCTVCKTGFGHVHWRAPLDIARGLASSTKLRTQRRSTSHEQDTCMHEEGGLLNPPVANDAAADYTPRPRSRAFCGPDRCPLSSFREHRSSRDRQRLYTLTSSLCCRSAPPVGLVDCCCCCGRSARQTTQVSPCPVKMRRGTHSRWCR